jgi:hypothetical protein
MLASRDLYKTDLETDLGGGEDVLDGLGDFGTDTITLDQADEEVSLRNELASYRLA